MHSELKFTKLEKITFNSNVDLHLFELFNLINIISFNFLFKWQYNVHFLWRDVIGVNKVREDTVYVVMELTQPKSTSSTTHSVRVIMGWTNILKLVPLKAPWKTNYYDELRSFERFLLCSNQVCGYNMRVPVVNNEYKIIYFNVLVKILRFLKTFIYRVSKKSF